MVTHSYLCGLCREEGINFPARASLSEKITIGN